MYSLPVKHCKHTERWKAERERRGIFRFKQLTIMHLHVKIQLEGKASRARVTEIIILLKCLSHGKTQRLNLFPAFFLLATSSKMDFLQRGEKSCRLNLNEVAAGPVAVERVGWWRKGEVWE